MVNISQSRCGRSVCSAECTWKTTITIMKAKRVFFKASAAHLLSVGPAINAFDS